MLYCESCDEVSCGQCLAVKMCFECEIFFCAECDTLSTCNDCEQSFCADCIIAHKQLPEDESKDESPVAEPQEEGFAFLLPVDPATLPSMSFNFGDV